MARFFLPRKQMHENYGTIDGQELVHMRQALRLKPGDRITVFDDMGWEHQAVIRALDETRGEVEILSSIQPRRESPLRVTLAIGLTKGDKLDFVVEKATELGVQSIIPFMSSYTVPKLDGKKMAARGTRWEKIALSAAKQCGRTAVPEVLPPRPFDDLIARPWPEAIKLFCWEKEADQSLGGVREKHGKVRTILIVTGPEGGFSAEEAKLARANGFEWIHLGPRILRAETAALTALTLVQFLWGDVG